MINNIDLIAASSSDLVWAVDTDTNTVYARNPTTKEFREVPADIEVAFLDVGKDGHVVALDPDGGLYFFNPVSGTFEIRADGLKFETISIGDGELWGLEKGTRAIQRWDASLGEFVEVEPQLDPGLIASDIVVAKEDDTVYLVARNLDEALPSDPLNPFDFTLWQFNFPLPTQDDIQEEAGAWDLVTSELGIPFPGLHGVDELVAVRDGELWALRNGDIYQLNNLDLADADAEQPTFIIQSERLGIDDVSLDQFAIDDSGILYGVAEQELGFYKTGTAEVQNHLGEHTDAVAIGADLSHLVHMAYSVDGGVRHAYLDDGEWINSQYIPGSGRATEVSIAFDRDDDHEYVIVSWIEGLGNEAEIYAAVGSRNKGYGGFTFGEAERITEDEVEDKELAMAVSPDGQIVLSSSKQEAYNRHDDSDVYAHTLDRTSFSLPSEIDSPNDDGTAIEFDPLYTFAMGEKAFSDLTSLGLPSQLGIALKGPIGIRLTAKLYNEEWTSSGHKFKTGGQFALSFDLSKLGIIPSQFLDVKFSGLVDLTASREFNNDGSSSSDLKGAGGYSLGLAYDFLGLSSGGGDALNRMYENIGFKIKMGAFFDAAFTSAYLDTSGSSDGPIELVDGSTNDPIDEETAGSDVKGKTSFADLARWGFGFLLPDSPYNPANWILDKQAIYSGFYVSADFTKNLSVEGRAGLNLTIEDKDLKDIAGRITADIIWKIGYLRLLDYRIGVKNGEEVVSFGSVYADANLGGTGTVHGDGLIFEGVSDEESDILDSEDFSFIFLSETQVVGVYVREDVEPGDNSLDTVNTIDGTYDPDTQEIEWHLDTISQVRGSEGLNTDPKIALHGEGANREVIVTWGNVSPNDDDLDTIAKTPPGTPYIVFGGNETDKIINLGDLWIGPPEPGDDGFWYRSTEYFYGIGSSASQLGDINSGGKTDFVIGAPDAERESGKTYVIFAENFAFGNIDTGTNGTNGFNVLGEIDSEFGFATAQAGDFNNDTIPDLAISAPGADNHTGAVYIVYGHGENDGWGDGVFTVADIGDVDQGYALGGRKLSGLTEGGRWGEALSGGYDFTGAGGDDLAVGSVQDGTITLVSASEAPITLELYGDVDTAPADYGIEDIGGTVAMLPDINGDGAADLLIGANSGNAFVVFGGDDFRNYARNYVASWEVDNSAFGGSDYQVLLSFFGEDNNDDGILSASLGEVARLRMEVFEDGVLDYTYNTQSNFDINYEIASGEVLVNNFGSNVSEGLYGLSIRGSSLDTPHYDLRAIFSGTKIQLDKVDDFRLVVGQTPGGNNQFKALSSPDRFDLQYLADIPRSGFRISTETPLSLQVAAAGDVDGDGHQDFIVGYDQSEDQDGNAISGESYIVFGGPELDQWSGIIDLATVEPVNGVNQVVNIGVAGGQVSAAGNVNGDTNPANGNPIGDILVSAPNDGSISELSGKSFVLYGDTDIRTPGFDVQTGFTLENTIEFQRSGVSLAPVGDLNNDGFGDFLIGAPQAMDSDAVIDASEADTLLYSTRCPSDGEWAPAAPVVDEDPISSGRTPAAMATTDSGGTIVAWVETSSNAQGVAISTLFTSTYDGAWSDPQPVGSAGTSNVITQVTIAENSSPPLIVWIEEDQTLTQTTLVYQSRYQKGAWQEPVLVDPMDADVPSSFGYNYIHDKALVVGNETVTVEDVSVTEPQEGSLTATFVVRRDGDLSQPSGDYIFRFEDFSASHGQDFIVNAPSGQFSFEAGQSEHTISVEILADDLTEGTHESLRVKIASADDDAVVMHDGLVLSDATSIVALMHIGDTNKPLNLASIDSGFKLNASADTALGYSVSRAGDLNGDGISDFMIAAPIAGSDNGGKVYVVYGDEQIALDLQEFDLDLLPAAKGAVLNGDFLGNEDVPGQAGAALGFGQTGDLPFVVVGAPGGSGNAGRVFVVTPQQFAGNPNSQNPNTLDLNSANTLELTIAGVSTTEDSFGRAIAVANLNNSGASGADHDDLIITSTDAVYVVYDVLSAGTQGSVTLDQFATTKIVNREGTGFGDGLSVADFDHDGTDDLMIGSSSGNALYDQFGFERGAGGFVTVLTGDSSGLLPTEGEVDIANPGALGFKLLGQATFTPSELSPAGDRQGGGIDLDSAPSAGSELVDGVGNAIAAADINGDGIKDLIVGAPLASLPDADGQYTQNGTNKGRVYVLFGGEKWQTDNIGDYQLLDLYGTPANGLVLEGSEVGGYAGASVTNVGYFRGTTDANTPPGADDIGIGAPGVNAGAGQSYIVFGSDLNYSGLDAASNVFKIDPLASHTEQNPLLVFTFQGPAALLSETNPTNAAALGLSVAGLGDINAQVFGTTGGTEFAMGAPYVNVNGESQTYIATGHPWIQPGQSLDVEDLRADNGFILTDAGTTIPIGDFNGDGFDDFLRQGPPESIFGGQLFSLTKSSLTLVLGASTFDLEASTNREIELDAWDGVLGQYYTAGDFDGDGTPDIAALLLDEAENFITPTVVVYSANQLADPETSVLSPTPVTAPANMANWGGENLFYDLKLHSPDLNGDGLDDLFVTGFGFSDDLKGTYALGTKTLGEFGPQFVFGGEEKYNGRVIAIADFDGDGRDEVVLSNSSETPQNGSARILSWDDSSQSLETVVTGFDWSGLASGAGSLFNRNATNMYAPPSSAGDVNGDGYEDFLISYVASAGGTSNPESHHNVSMLVFGAEDLSDITGTIIEPTLLPGASFNNSAEVYIPRVFGDIVGDVNQDGYDDLLISQDNPNRFAYVVFGGEDLPRRIVLPFDNPESFEYGFAIKGFEGRGGKLPYLVSATGDVNGDGLADFVMSDDSEFDLSFVVYGEKREAAPAEEAAAITDTADNTATLEPEIINGTKDNDYIVQSYDASNQLRTVEILAMEGDDIVLTRQRTAVLAYLGESDDRLGLADVTNGRIRGLDGGNGFDTLFVNSDAGEQNTLDLTDPLTRGRVTGFELVDLGTNNGLRVDVATFKDLTGSGNTLLVRGVDAQFKTRYESNGAWSLVGENAYAGVKYDVYQFVHDGQSDSNIFAWLEQGGVRHVRSLLSPGTQDADELTGGNEDEGIFGRSGDDFLLGRGGDDVVEGGDDNDLVSGGHGDDTVVGDDGDDLLKGGANDDILWGGPGIDVSIGGAGNDIIAGPVEELLGDTIIGFGSGDTIRIGNFDRDHLWIVSNNLGQSEIHFDTDGDGLSDGTLLIEGLFGWRSLAVEQFDTDTFITLDGQDTIGSLVSGFVERISDPEGVEAVAYQDTLFHIDAVLQDLVPFGTELKDLPQPLVDEVEDAFVQLLTLLHGDGTGQDVGGSANDVLVGSSSGGELVGGRGWDLFVGPSENDWVSYGGPKTDFSVDWLGHNLVAVAKPGGSADLLAGIERIAFEDGGLVFDIESDCVGFVYRMYKAGFDRSPDLEGLRFWTDVMDQLKTVMSVGEAENYLADQFLSASEFEDRFGQNPSNEEYVDAMYQHVLGRDPDVEGRAWWVDGMNQGLGFDDVLVAFAKSDENVANTRGFLEDGVWVV